MTTKLSAGKSIYRCTSTFQGDKCKLDRYHMKDPKLPAHVGSFTIWNEERVLGKALGAEVRHKRNRHANRTIRGLDVAALRLTVGEHRSKVLADLKNLEQFYSTPAVTELPAEEVIPA